MKHITVVLALGVLGLWHCADGHVAGQRGIVAEARAQASTPGASADSPALEGVVTRRVWAAGAASGPGSVSADGRYVSYVDWATGDLAVRDLSTGQNRRLHLKESWNQSIEYALVSRISPDTKHVAYAWFNTESHDLRIAGFDGSEPRVLYKNPDGGDSYPADWSPDGKQILASVTRADGTLQIVLVSASDGSARVLKTLEWRAPLQMRFSPDGRFIAYDFPPEQDSPNRDIFVLATDATSEHSLVEHPANDTVLGWAPDGRSLLFASDRTGTVGAWIVEVDEGRPQSAPELVKADLWQMSPLGMTRNGSYYYSVDVGTHGVYTAALDLKAGQVLGPPRVVAADAVFRSGLDLSPDGNYVVYASGRNPRVDTGVLAIRSLETGDVRELPDEFALARSLHWSPDGQSLLVIGRDNTARSGVFLIDLESASRRRIRTSASVNAYYSDAAWAPDGQTVFLSVAPVLKIGLIVMHDLASGEETELYRSSEATILDLALSPDGQWLAFIGLIPTPPVSPGVGVLSVMPSTGGEPRELLRVNGPDETIGGKLGLVWTPDGRQLLFGRAVFSGDSARQQLWSISAEGGQPHELGFPVSHLNVQNLRVHPDGRLVAFSGGTNQPPEVWVMENFLPEGQTDPSGQ